MREKINEINKKLEPYYLLIVMIVFIIGGFISIYKILFSPPELLVRIEKENINYPSSINKTYVDIYEHIQDSTDNKSLKSKALQVYDYLVQTKQQRVIEIINNTDRSIKSINIRYTSVRKLTSWAVSSSYLLENEKDKLLKNILFQKASGIVYLKDAVNLPPNGNLKIFLWGEFNPYDWDEALTVDYDGGAAKIEYNKTFSGYKAILAEYFFEIFIIIILTFILVYHLQIRNHVANKKTNSGIN
ncbi:MAG: hypothetical protein HOO86_09050 [Bacteroidales bacterium]|nr:hypothetical protein [Bacteroidales bacterium]